MSRRRSFAADCRSRRRGTVGVRHRRRSIIWSGGYNTAGCGRLNGKAFLTGRLLPSPLSPDVVDPQNASADHVALKAFRRGWTGEAGQKRHTSPMEHGRMRSGAGDGARCFAGRSLAPSEPGRMRSGAGDGARCFAGRGDRGFREVRSVQAGRGRPASCRGLFFEIQDAVP